MKESSVESINLTPQKVQLQEQEQKIANRATRSEVKYFKSLTNKQTVIKRNESSSLKRAVKKILTDKQKHVEDIYRQKNP